MAQTDSSDALNVALKKVNEAWRLRFQGRNREAEALIAALENESRSCVDTQVQMQIDLVRISLLRAKGLVEESNSMLDNLQSAASEKTLRLPCQFYLQKAINLYVADDFSPALEFFLIADAVATQPGERAVAQMNILACLDNLNLPWGATLAQLDSISLLTKNTDFSEPVQKQLRAFHQRRAFREGRFGELFAQADSLNEEMDQSQYYRLWASRLPYVKSKLKQSDGQLSRLLNRLLQKLTLDDKFHARNYRLKTVVADARIKASQDYSPETRQQSDRIYLWTWNWLAEPSEANRKNLAECLLFFDFKSAFKKMTYEDFQMMRNSLSWISLFQPTLAQDIERYLENFQIKDCDPFPIFEFEYLLFQLVNARKRNLPTRELERAVESHALYGSKEIAMQEHAERWSKAFAGIANQAFVPGAIVINEGTNQVSSRGKTIISKPIAQILLALSSKEFLTFSEAIWIGFNIAPFSYDAHFAKIHNCLARIKKEILPRGASIKTRDGMIFWEKRPRAIEVKRILPHERPLLDEESFDFGRLSFSAAHRTFEKPIHPRMVLKKMQGRRVLSREELQEAMSLSKASAVRWVQKWQKQGLIRREGSGRAVKYHIEIIEDHRLSSSV